MAMKKKITAATLALSMAVATIAVIPLSNNGLAEKLGAVSVYATADTVLDSNFSYVTTRLDAIYNALDESEKAKVSTLKHEIQSKIHKAELVESFSIIVDKFNITPDQKSKLYDFFIDLSNNDHSADLDYTDLQAIVNNNNYKRVIKDLGIDNGIDNLTIDDIFKFLFGTGTGTRGLEGEFISALSDLTFVELTELLDSESTASKDFIKGIVEQVIDDEVAGAKFGNLIKNAGVTGADLSTAWNSISKYLITSKVNDALKVVASAYIKSGSIELKPPVVDPNVPGDTEGPVGGGGGGGAAGGGSASGGGGSTAPAADLEKVSTVDASKSVVVTDGIAKLVISESTLSSALEALGKAAKVEGKTDVTLTLDLGVVDASKFEIPLSKAVIDAAKEQGVANIAFVVNGLKVSIPLGQFNDSINLNVATVDNSVATEVTALNLASKVYEFELLVGSHKATQFKQPITVSIPLENVAGLDGELLSVAKIVDGKLQFEGGVVAGQTIVEPRDTFSSYVVAENKVSFKDITSVQSWARRQIQVVAAKGAIEGRGGDLFAPKDQVTRAEFAKMLTRALNLDNQLSSATFSDVKSSDWFGPYVAAAAEKGIINGRSNTVFAPSDNITRAEMATMVSRALNNVHNLKDTVNTSAELQQFSDAGSINASLQSGVAFAAKHKLVIGNDGIFQPNANASRAEAAVIIYRAINFK